ncbi:MAG: hypothetical protein K6A34_06665 [Methanobrevibacter sp.]|nr:hypothetical protein [Methanobrevibacter sp.]
MKKKYLLTPLFIFILSISAVNASELNENQTDSNNGTSEFIQSNSTTI